MKIYNVKIKTMDSDRRVIENGWVEITDGIISAVGRGYILYPLHFFEQVVIIHGK